jgi:hydroxyacylglutathione hydrolase
VIAAYDARMEPDRDRPRRLSTAAPLLALFFALAAAGCAVGLQQIQDPPQARAVTTGGMWVSMIYAARTDEGVIVIDLGWERDADQLKHALADIGATPADVVAVFITHSHRDHIAAWPAVRHATFHLGAAEVPYFVGEEEHDGPVPRLAGVVPPDLPDPGGLRIHAFSTDTAFAFGRDTLYAFLVPGHTPGSAAYLFRGVLFTGDALSYTRPFGFHHTKWIFADDMERGRASLDSLWPRLERHNVEAICTAHAKCTTLQELVEEGVVPSAR